MIGISSMLLLAVVLCSVILASNGMPLSRWGGESEELSSLSSILQTTMHRPSDESLRRCSQLLMPLNLTTFMVQYFDLAVLHLRRQPNFYGALLHIDDIDILLEMAFGTQDSLETRRLLGHGDEWKLVKRVLKNGTWISSSFRNASFTFKEVHDAFRMGYTLLVNRVQNKWDSVKRITDLLSDCTGYRVSANIYLSPPGAQGFEAHVDWMSGLILQLHGSKLWKIYSPPLVSLPRPDLVSTPYNGSEILSKLLAEDVVLTPGDLLLVPRGVAHEAAAVSGHQPSLHLTLGIETATHFSVQALFHHIIREHFLVRDCPVGGLLLWDDDGTLSIQVPAEYIEPFLHLIIHCISSGSDADTADIWRVSVGIVDGHPRSNVKRLLKLATQHLENLQLGDVLRYGINEGIFSLNLDNLNTYSLLPLFPRRMRATSSTKYLSRFSLSAPLLLIVKHLVDTNPGHIVDRHSACSSDTSENMLLSVSWQNAAHMLLSRWRGAYTCTPAAWIAFRVDGDHHRTI